MEEIPVVKPFIILANGTQLFLDQQQARQIRKECPNQLYFELGPTENSACFSMEEAYYLQYQPNNLASIMKYYFSEALPDRSLKITDCNNVEIRVTDLIEQLFLVYIRTTHDPNKHMKFCSGPDKSMALYQMSTAQFLTFLKVAMENELTKE